MLTNDNLTLEPQTSFEGPALTFDFPGLRIGVAEYAEGPTGCTVFAFNDYCLTAVDVRGGAPGTTGDYSYNRALCFAGGSLYGLEATYGVAAELFATRGYSTAFGDIATVSGAVVFDFGGRDNAIYPDKQLGRAAFKAAREGIFPLGPRGAGRSTHCGLFERELSGQGGAFRQLGSTRLAVFSVVNCIGVIVNRQGQVVKGNLDAQTGQRSPYLQHVERQLAEKNQPEPSPGNTTLTVVVTNQKLSSRDLTQFGRQVHASLGRAIQPFHTVYDGDVLYAMTTNEVENATLDTIGLGVMAAELAWDAVLEAVAYS